MDVLQSSAAQLLLRAPWFPSRDHVCPLVCPPALLVFIFHTPASGSLSGAYGQHTCGRVIAARPGSDSPGARLAVILAFSFLISVNFSLTITQSLSGRHTEASCAEASSRQMKQAETCTETARSIKTWSPGRALTCAI